MRPLRLLMTVLGLGALASCSPGVAVHDQAYYAAHVDQRASQLTACQSDPGRLGSTPNCLNAQAADADSHAAHFYGAPKPVPRVADPAKL